LVAGRSDVWPIRGSIEHRFGEQLQGELRWKGLVIDAPETPKLKRLPMAAC
jgi:septal ring factor EnvC (AmiA/AmiB activator)